MKCEYCKKEHDGSYGSGRFCSGKCARGFSTKEKRQEINEKVSKKLSIDGLSKQEKIEKKRLEKHASYMREIEAASILDLSKRTVAKIMKRMNMPCSYCGWHVEGVIGDIHHILEKKNGGGDNMENLTYLCPNCHRLAHSGLIEKEKLISLQDYISDTWKDFYYIKGR